MKKAACVVLILTMVIFLVIPLSSEARGGSRGSGGGSHAGSSGGGHWSGAGARGGNQGGGHWGSYSRGGHWSGGGHWGGGGWWPWWPWAVIGGAAVIAPYYYSPYYEPPAVIREQTPAYVQPAPSVTPSSAERIFVYPRQGQSEELQAKDRYECHSWAVSQTQYDPTQRSADNVPAVQRNQMLADYRRAEDACLDGRGYTVK